MGIDVEIMLLEREDCVAQCAVCEVENAFWIERLAHVAGFEMEVWACRAACRASVADEFASLDNVAAIHDVFAQMPVISL